MGQGCWASPQGPCQRAEEAFRLCRILQRRNSRLPLRSHLPPTAPQGSKWAINVFSMALYQAYAINYSPVPIISQVIAPLFCPANCTKGGRGEQEGGGTPISTRLDFTCNGKCLFSWK